MKTSMYASVSYYLTRVMLKFVDNVQRKNIRNSNIFDKRQLHIKGLSGKWNVAKSVQIAIKRWRFMWDQTIEKLVLDVAVYE